MHKSKKARQLFKRIADSCNGVTLENSPEARACKRIKRIYCDLVHSDYYYQLYVGRGVYNTQPQGKVWLYYNFN